MKNDNNFLDGVISIAFSMSFFWLFLLQPFPALICIVCMLAASHRKKKKFRKRF